MTVAKTRTCHWCGITKSTASRDTVWLCSACKSIDRRARKEHNRTVVKGGVALKNGSWKMANGIKKWEPSQHQRSTDMRPPEVGFGITATGLVRMNAPTLLPLLAWAEYLHRPVVL